MQQSNVKHLLAQAIADHRGGRLAQAEGGYRAVLARDGRNIVALQNLALIGQQLGHAAEAIKILEHAATLAPGNADVLNTLGSIYGAEGRTAKAERSFRQAVAADPKHGQAASNLGTLLVASGRAAEALPHFRRAVAAMQLAPMVMHNYALALMAHNRLDEAEKIMRRAHAAQPSASGATNLGVLLRAQGKPHDALPFIDQAVAMAPNVAEYHYNRALALLLLGDYREGWQEYEWRRKKTATSLSGRNYKQPLWQGEQAGTLFLYPEQGLGDAIQFARFLPLAARRAKRVLIELPPGLHRLFKDMAIGNVELCTAPPPAFDVHASVMSLPSALGIELAHIPETAAPYLAPEPAKVEEWRKRLPKGMRTIGIAWQGSTANQMDALRSFPLAHFAELAAVPSVQLVSLQKGYGSEQIDHFGSPILDIAPELDTADSFVDTAALMASLDLVVTCDSALAHLAGATGVTTWVLLHNDPDWRWLVGRDDSPWYPSVRLFRQQYRKDWAGVFRTVADALRQEFRVAPGA